jgi:hypothetical protein
MSTSGSGYLSVLRRVGAWGLFCAGLYIFALGRFLHIPLAQTSTDPRGFANLCTPLIPLLLYWTAALALMATALLLLRSESRGRGVCDRLGYAGIGFQLANLHRLASSGEFSDSLWIVGLALVAITMIASLIPSSHSTK